MKDRSDLETRIAARKKLGVQEVQEVVDPFLGEEIVDTVDDIVTIEEEKPKPHRSTIRRATLASFEDDPEEAAAFIKSGMHRERPPAFASKEEIDDSMTVLPSETEGSDTAKAITALLGDGDFRTKTDLTADQVRALAVLLEISQKFRAKRLQDFAENFMALMISHGRGSRREVVQSFSGLEYFGKRQVPPDGNTPFRPG